MGTSAQRPAAKERLPANRYVPIFFTYAILAEILRLRRMTVGGGKGST